MRLIEIRNDAENRIINLLIGDQRTVYQAWKAKKGREQEEARDFQFGVGQGPPGGGPDGGPG